LQRPAGTDIAAILEEVDVRGIRPSRHVGSLLKQRTDDLDMEIIIRKFVDVSEDDVTTSWEAGTRVRTPVGDIGVVVVTSYRSHLYSHPGEPCIATVDVLVEDTGQVLTYRADRLRPLAVPGF